MTYRTLLLCLLGVLLALSTAVAQTMNIHTSDGETSSFNLADIDSMTFSDANYEAPRPGEERVFELVEGVEIVMCWIPAGSFMMGAQEDEEGALEREYPRHRVTFENGFWMGKYEVTQAQWEAVTGNNPSSFDGENLPVEQVSWEDIHEEFFTQIDGFRLPSESEWEYACRAGTTTRFYWGDDPDYEEVDGYAWYSENSNSRTHEVGQKRPNAWRLHDMSGNVYEWCEDGWHENYNGAPNDGRPWLENQVENRRSFRCGSWYDYANHSRSSMHFGYDASFRYSHLGFRLVRDAE